MAISGLTLGCATDVNREKLCSDSSVKQAIDLMRSDLNYQKDVPDGSPMPDESPSEEHHQ
ncbi:hypothetical protein BST81_20830 [Leptolyngbya sp. 'hensonii']|uniref:hypothetical protein n=1 Tax=Leptolyngbya sp. 'hensonii' TaxID=1922337 RepID=UPI00095EDCAD|nr:hypothetical protein [Leptolyngbya sp. 'hensonii']OLP16430.1 hypothetical protein BST81_20830 [Leptolyngbya sp. 'hensonii']